jgi:hypothetical protein
MPHRRASLILPACTDGEEIGDRREQQKGGEHMTEGKRIRLTTLASCAG